MSEQITFRLFKLGEEVPDVKPYDDVKTTVFDKHIWWFRD